MTDDYFDDMPAGLEYSAPAGRVLRSGGYPIAARRPTMPGDIIVHGPGVPIEYTSPHRGVQRVDGRPPPARRQPRPADTGDHSVYWQERHRHEQAAYRRAHPTLGVYGRAIPYNTILDGGLGDWLVFTPDTEWLLRRPDLPLQLEHSSLLGTCRLDETPGGLFAHGTVFAERAHVVGDRHDLSPQLTLIDTVTRPDGVLEVRSASLGEISLVRRPAWLGHTAATLWQRAAA